MFWCAYHQRMVSNARIVNVRCTAMAADVPLGLTMPNLPNPTKESLHELVTDVNKGAQVSHHRAFYTYTHTHAHTHTHTHTHTSR